MKSVLSHSTGDSVLPYRVGSNLECFTCLEKKKRKKKEDIFILFFIVSPEIYPFLTKTFWCCSKDKLSMNDNCNLFIYLFLIFIKFFYPEIICLF